MIRSLFIVLLALPVFAHDFWIEPSSFQPTPGEEVSLSLRVGEHFKGDPVTRRAARIESFVVRDGERERAVNGIEGGNPAGVVELDGAGVAVVGYRGKATPHRLAAEAFNRYLREEGMDDLRATSQAAQREHFYRFAKTFLRAGEGAAVPAPLGYRIEIQPLTDPFASGPLKVQLTLDEKPLAGALITAMHRDGREPLTARTDAAGAVTLNLGSGVWLLKSTHVMRVDADTHDWDSLWASLTFER